MEGLQAELEREWIRWSGKHSPAF